MNMNKKMRKRELMHQNFSLYERDDHE